VEKQDKKKQADILQAGYSGPDIYPTPKIG
jgi:hypothetical protein